MVADMGRSLRRRRSRAAEIMVFSQVNDMAMASSDIAMSQ